MLQLKIQLAIKKITPVHVLSVIGVEVVVVLCSAGISSSCRRTVVKTKKCPTLPSSGQIKVHSNRVHQVFCPLT